jgi:hypothetical protein
MTRTRASPSRKTARTRKFESNGDKSKDAKSESKDERDGKHIQVEEQQCPRAHLQSKSESQDCKDRSKSESQE